MKKLNKFIKLGFLILTLTLVTTISSTSTVINATTYNADGQACLSNGDCPTTKAESRSMDDWFNSAPTQQQPQYHPQPAQQSQPVYHAPKPTYNNYVAPKPTYNNYVAPAPQPVQHQNTYVAPNKNNVSAEQNTPVQNTENSTNNAEQTKKDTEEKAKKGLTQLKNEVVKKINLLPELSTTEKKNYISKLTSSDSKENVNQILTDATNRNKSNLDYRLKKEKLAKQKKEEQERKNTFILWSAIIGGVVVIGGIFGFFIYKHKTNSNTK